MGGGKGGLYMGTYNPSDTKTDFCTFSRNVEKVSKKYPLNPSGYFGEKGKNHRVIVSDNPIETSEDFYKLLAVAAKSLSCLTERGSKLFLKMALGLSTGS